MEDRREKLHCSDGKKRQLYVWEPDHVKRVFIIVHGGMDHAGAYDGPASHFRSQGFASVCLNQQGHDHRGPDHPYRVIIGGFDGFLDDLDRVLAWTKSSYPDLPVYVLAHSMGSLIATHFGIRKVDHDSQLKGFVLSSPYYVNAIPASRLVKKLAGVLAGILPRQKVPIEDFVDQVSHDPRVVSMHRKDQEEGLKATESSFRFASELLKAQAWIPKHLGQWKHPLLVFVAGTDRLADGLATQELLKKVDPSLMELVCFPENYHENYNELNREEVFARIQEWVNAH